MMQEDGGSGWRIRNSTYGEHIYLPCLLHINNKDGVSISKFSDDIIYCQGTQLVVGTMPPLDIAKEILQELFELNFCFEFVALDEQMCITLNGTNEDHQVTLGKCFPSSNSFLLVVRLEDANKGLAAPLKANQLPFILAL